MEPIDEWMQAALKQVAPKEIQIGAATVRLQPQHQPTSHIDPTWQHPDEDCFAVPVMRGDELTAVPDRSGPMPAMADVEWAIDPASVPTKGSTLDEMALHAFLNAASAPERMGGDNVTLPHHYARFNIEPIRFICENNLNFFQANIVKYILRWDAKNGLEDLRKAKRYLEMFIKFVQKDPDWWRAAA